MPTVFIGCIECNTLLVVTTDVDSSKRASAAGWQHAADGWLCPKHQPPATSEEAAELALTTTALPSPQ
jgi:hypothetical protein